MRRQDKYKDTETFHFYNANPHNRFTTDCVIRAISTATRIPYNTVVMELAKIQCETGFDDGDAKVYGKYLEQLGWKKMKQPRKSDNTKYTGKEFCKELMRYDSNIASDEDFDITRVIAHIGGNHIVAIIEGQVNDTWDSTAGCIGNYWVNEM